MSNGSLNAKPLLGLVHGPLRYVLNLKGKRLDGQGQSFYRRRAHADAVGPAVAVSY
jgi:hypothetical protein